MRFELQVVTGDEARAGLRRIGVLAPGSAVRSLPPPAFVDGEGVLSPSTLAETLAPISAPEPELGVHITRDGLLPGFRFVVLDRQRLVWNRMEGAGGRTPNHLDPHLTPNGASGAVLDYDDDDVDVFEGPHLLMHWDAAHMYHHWMFECAPRLVLAMRAAFLKDFRFAFPSDRPKFVDETLDLLKVPAERRVYFDPKRLSRFEVLGLTPVPVFERHACSVSILEALRSSLLAAVPPDGGSGPRKVFFTRRDAPSSERLLITEPEVVAALEAEGFVALEPGRMSVTEQIRTVNAAETIAYVHGSAGANLLFAAPDANIVHVFPDSTQHFVSHGVGPAIAGANQAYVFGPSFQRRAKYHNSPWLVSPERVVRAAQRLQRDL